jgi:alanyl-tRNA synthetase
LEQLDSYLKTFESHVVAAEDRADGRWVALAESAFYPTSGGQLHDTGTLNSVVVTEVVKRQERVWHRLERPALETGQGVSGVIDWDRRYRHMQRHSGQHLLSQALLRVNPAFETRSVSLSAPSCTIDFAGDPVAEDLERVEAVVNRAAYQNLVITAFEVDESELNDFSLRRPPKVRGRIRLVNMGDWELAACGGTHLRASAEALPLKTLRFERIRGGLTRLYFLAGLEAFEDYQLKHRVGYELAVSFSAKVSELPERVSAVRQQLGEAKRETATLVQKLARAMAAELTGTATPIPNGRLVTYALPEGDAALLKELAETLQASGGTVALLAAPDRDRVRLLFSRSEDLDFDMKALLQTALPAVAGKGGGRPEFAQGSGSDPSGLERALALAQNHLLGRVGGADPP